ncbi:DUF3375 domain-containing protein [Mycobacteroides abscessus subsp. abscessus]|uniref:DUF3375 domain-containing protein n=1 Tax=Mycobacteroides abscessus TaxID=36809 RepID=UPI0019D0670A|nr:DUF3375 domain-containing protein [Mycobacteroides abscessus]MBN7438508.1 DUF3375 domain-containing protein [Mycobacteroides abscessus subsp. abscessus]
MSDVVGEHDRARRAFERETLKLLRKKHAPVILAIFMTTFTQDRTVFPADQFHALVESQLTELRASGRVDFDTLEGRTARAICWQWAEDKWLQLSSDNPDKIEQYSLTSHAQEAIDYVHRLARDRSVFGQSRIRTIVDAARRCADSANPDRTDRIARIDAEIAALTEERDRLAAGGEIEQGSVDEIHEDYLNIRDLLDQLPADFLRLSEHFKGIHHVLIEEFGQEDARVGQVLDRYLERSKQMMAESLEGRAFNGAVELLRDEAMILQLRRDLDAILSHPFGGSLTIADAAEFRNAVSGIRRGINTVLEQRRRVSATLRTHITSHDPLRDRELDNLLRRARTELAGWVAETGPRARVPLDLGLAGIDIGNIRTRFYNPADHAPPPPLVDTSSDAAAAPTLDELRRTGGPSVAALRSHLLEQLRAGGQASAGSVFAGLPENMRRPVEVLGLLQLASVAGALDTAAASGARRATEVYITVRNDGTERTLDVPLIELTVDHIAALAGTKDSVK